MLKNVFVILLNYNGWEDTLACLRSLGDVYHERMNIVIVDNKSTDDSVERIESQINGHTVLLKSDSNGGFSAGNNIGIRYAIQHGAEYVLLLNNDTLVEEDFISPMVDFAETHPECGGISSRIYYDFDRTLIWYDGGTFKRNICRAVHYRFNSRNSPVHGIHEAGFISGCCMLIPSDVIKKVGWMDERYFLYVEDTEYCLRILRAGYRLFWDADHCIYHKVSASTGKVSDLSRYYEIRNRYLLADTYLSFTQKVSMKCYDLVFFAYKILKRTYKVSILIDALKDAKHKKYGRR